MTNTTAKPRWFQFSLRTLIFLTLVVATFFGGYRVGFHAGRQSRHEVPNFDDLIELIRSTTDSTVSDFVVDEDPFVPELRSQAPPLSDEEIQELRVVLSMKSLKTESNAFRLKQPRGIATP